MGDSLDSVNSQFQSLGDETESESVATSVESYIENSLEKINDYLLDNQHVMRRLLRVLDSEGDDRLTEIIMKHCPSYGPIWN